MQCAAMRRVGQMSVLWHSQEMNLPFVRMVFFMSLFHLKAEEVGHAPNCIMVEAINQSGARIFLGVNLEEIVSRGMKISLRVFSALTSLVI